MCAAPSSRPDLDLSRHSLLGEGFQRLAHGLGPFIDPRMAEYFDDEHTWNEVAADRMGRGVEAGTGDPLFQLLVLRRFWGPVFADHFSADLRSLIGQLIEARNLWAHFSLPDDPDYLDRILLGLERLLAPVEPEGATELRTLRSRLRDPIADDDGPPLERPDTDALELRSQLSETELAFERLQGEHMNLARQLETRRRAEAGAKLQLTAAEQRLLELQDRSEALEDQLQNFSLSKDRMEWLFVSLLAVLLLVMALVVA